MKKALSLALVVIMVCIPMSVMAADNTSPMTALAVENYGEVTVGAGEKLYFSATAQSMLDQEVCVYDTQYEGGFNLYSVYNARPVLEASVASSEMGSASIKMPQVMMGTIIFAIENTTAVEKTYGVMFWDAEGTTVDSACYMQQGNNTFEAYGSPSPTAYRWMAQKAGTVEIAMSDTNSSGWKYSVEVVNAEGVTTYTGETHYCNDTTVVKKEQVSVGEYESVVVWINSLDTTTGMSVAGDVNFTMTYAASEKDPYVFNYEDLYVGSNEVALDGIADVTIRPFSGCSIDDMWNSLTGRYKITVPAGVTLSIWEQGAYNDVTWSYDYTKTSTVSGTTFEFDYTEAWSNVLFGFENAGGTVTIERIGDVQSGGGQTPGGSTEYTDYINKVTPKAFTFTGIEKNLQYVWVEESARVAVLGADGYYHIGTAEGPVLYVDIDMELHPYSENYIVAGLDKIALEGRLYNYNTKISYNKALSEYSACKDSKTGLYPVTEDIKEILVEYGAGQGWYTVNGPAYMFGAQVDAENAWLFMCCYEARLASAKEVDWITGTEKELEIRVDAEYSDYIDVKVDGKVLDVANYTVKEGSTIVTLSSKYMAALKDGKYTVTVGFYNSVGEEIAFDTVVTVSKTVSSTTTSPSTGDGTNMMVWAIVMVVAAGAAVVAFERKRRAR